MYRQVKVHQDDCRYQTIFWRESPDVPARQYELTTVTYGISSSAYLAMRVIHELAVLNETQYPEASRTLKETLFVDDVVSGGSTLEAARSLQEELVTVLEQGGFQLRKWSSNHPDLLDHLPKDHLEVPFRFQEAGDNIFKILGMEWCSKGDYFLYHVTNIGTATTKRGILSNIARLYDPCGFLTPVVFTAKALLQSLWLRELGWDERLPPECIEEWQKIVTQFSSLSRLRINRHILPGEPVVCELHGFCDASERGYAAAIYLRVVDAAAAVSVNLVIGKSRVAPIKQKLTIPKLELCGALLLAKLMCHARNILLAKLVLQSTTAWCDSNIVILWIHTLSHKLQIYEGNRVSQIQSLVPAECWRHVPSALNPADCASRGLYPAEVVNHALWWSPSWLADQEQWPEHCPRLDEESLPAIKKSPVVASIQVEQEMPIVVESSSLSKMLNTVGLMLDTVDVLTPGHFLVGQPLLSLPEYNFEDTPINRLRRWSMVQQMSQHFWRRWQREYLHTLQERPKWTRHLQNLNIGDLVLIQEPNLPPLQWKTGRISKVCPGSDGTVRVVEVKTSNSTLTRPVVRVVAFPKDD